MKVSIIIPIYNMEKTLDRCLNSVVNQTYDDIEIILINDGSKDSSLDIAMSYQKKDNRIIIVNQENKGISVARNNGLKEATGDLLAFVDSDDYIELDMIEKLTREIISNNADIAISDYYMFDENKKIKNTVGYPSLFGGSIYDNPLIIRDIDYAPWNKIYKKELFDGIEFPVNTKYEDFETILKVFSKAKKIVKVDYPLYDYYINMSGETRTQSIKNMDMLKIVNNLYDYFDFNGKDMILKDVFFEVVSEKLLNSASTLFKICNFRETSNYINNVYTFLNKHTNWHSLYKKNKIDSNYIKFIRGNKFIFKTYAFLRIALYKIIGR